MPTQPREPFDVALNIGRVRQRLAELDGQDRPGTPFEVAVAHIQAHESGLCPTTRRMASGARGTAKACGVALALYELARYDAQYEAAKPLIDLAREAEALRGELLRRAGPLRDALRAHAPTAAAHHEDGEAVPLDAQDPLGPRAPVTSHNCQLRCEIAAGAYQALGELELCLETLAELLPRGIDSEELVARARVVPGGDPLILLRQVEAWLRAGGFSRGEVGELIDDGGAPGKALRTDRVRFRENNPPAAMAAATPPAPASESASTAAPTDAPSSETAPAAGPSAAPSSDGGPAAAAPAPPSSDGAPTDAPPAPASSDGAPTAAPPASSEPADHNEPDE